MFVLTLGSAQAQTRPPDLDSVTLPPGFSISVFASDVENAREIAIGDQGTVFVGTRQGDHVTALVDTDGDFQADQVYRIGSGLFAPNGVLFVDGDLYVGEVSRILRYDDIETNLANPPAPVIIRDDLPQDTHHGLKVLGLGPDNKLYFGIGYYLLFLIFYYLKKINYNLFLKIYYIKI
jgi:glucose/arabinose dehydrogenase